MTAITGNSITGITNVINSTDVVNKQYVDDASSQTSEIASQTGNEGKFLTTTDGTSTSWDYVSNYQDFTTLGIQTFTVSTKTNILYIEAIGGGGGGSAGLSGPTYAKNGFTWSLRTSGFGSSSIANIASSGSNYVANDRLYLSYSTDNITWTARTSGFGTSSINALTYSNNEYLIGGRVETISWTLRTAGFGTSSILGLIYGNGIYVSVSSGFIRASTDAVTWVLRTVAGASVPFVSSNDGIYDGTNYFVLGAATNPGRLITSTDTIHWIIRTSGFGTTALQAISYGSGETEKYILGGSAGILRSSTNSISWITRTSGFGTSSITSAMYDGNDYYIGGLGPFLRASTDGIAWSTRTSPITGYYTNIIYVSNTYVASSTTGQIISSTNGIQWTLRTSGFGTSTLNGLTYNINLYVAGSVGNRIATSTDAIVWTTRTSGFGTTVYRVQSDGINYVVAGSGGAVLTSTQDILSSYGSGALLNASTDSVSWVSRTNNTLNSQTITLLSFAGSYAFAHGTNYMDEYDFLNVSTDNITWELRTAGFGRSQITSITFDGNFYIAGGASGLLLSSTDSITWSLRTSGTTYSVNNLEYLNSTYLYATPFVNGPTYITSTITNTLLGPASLTASTTPTTGTNDQGSWTLSLPWTVIYNGVAYNVIYVNTNSFLNFDVGIVESPYTNAPSATYPPYPKILIGAANNSCQRIYYGTEGSEPNRTYRIRFEGTAATTGTLGAPNILWEAIFYEQFPGQIDILISSRRTGAADGAYSASALLASGNIPSNDATRFLWEYITESFLNSSTDGIAWTLRTSGFGSTIINTIAYSNTGNNFIIGGNSGRLSSSSDGITWKVNTSNTSLNLLSSVHTNNNYLVGGQNGTLIEADVLLSGTGGSGGSYTSWYIPKSIVSSNITVNVGSGGAGGINDGDTGLSGAGTTISWTGPGGTYTLTANGGRSGGVAGAAQTSITSYFYTTAGGTGAAAVGLGVGITATAQINSYQSTGGGSGAATTSTTGGAGGTISFYGNSTFSAGGDNTGTNGVTGIAITSLPYGYGGGGGGAGASTAGSGSPGIRGGGGGGGASIPSAVGTGGTGGDGFVRITWW